ncbi:hypothetical protein ASPWEDRAFT_558988 [Aspergillus wentii DTO 134E9]|uniref:Zn(2)-C6 fungal-type domain-containing protein n=1 Tax=Aspergillus wentii DTO 134E9 TaxID=1073089 RepID=A0A1L9RGL6_ASPWE|nr:uncharacterized protein ASPWEDRAFT_558988 [Aspergillus wentii DTO 134E9]OJJ34089.1 hypothetical protein ASPWEDRAFT_558988 [Aspergillus wentii DTO 134E9]
MQGIKRTRHRVPKACLVCRCRKTRCDIPIMGARCLACEKRDTNCVYKGSTQQRPTRYLVSPCAVSANFKLTIQIYRREAGAIIWLEFDTFVDRTRLSTQLYPSRSAYSPVYLGARRKYYSRGRLANSSGA